MSIGRAANGPENGDEMKKTIMMIFAGCLVTSSAFAADCVCKWINAVGQHGEFKTQSLEIGVVAKSVPVGQITIACQGGNEKQHILLTKKDEKHYCAEVKVCVGDYRLVTR